MLQLGCAIKLSHYTQVFSSTLGPMAVAVLIFLVYHVRVGSLAPPNHEQLKKERLGVRATHLGGSSFHGKLSGSEDEIHTDDAELTSLWLGSRRQALLRKHLNAFLLLTFIVLPTTSVTIMRTFHCESFDTDERFLHVDLSLKCDTPEHASMCTFAVIMIFLYPIGIPGEPAAHADCGALPPGDPTSRL